MKKIIILLISFISLFIINCNNEKTNNYEITETIKTEEIIETKTETIIPHEHEWLEANCLEPIRCKECGETRGNPLGHDFDEIISKASCTKEGMIYRVCKRCQYEEVEILEKLEHNFLDGECTKCHEKDPNFVIPETPYKNGFTKHGKLSVSGSDLVDKNGEKTLLVGLSTHGLQWCSNFINYDTFKNIRDEFGINVIRLSLYPDEGGYCDSSASLKDTLYKRLKNGIKYATLLDMYVVIDWHMLGAENPLDKDPNYYKEEAKDLFLKVINDFPNNENLLFEIMNEPSPPTTFQDCKNYANYIIPYIREKSDNIILVGGINWSGTSSLVAWSKDLLDYSNIMYTMHFYAGDHESTTQLENLYNNGLPIFVTEHGGMNNDGDGAISYEYIDAWWDALIRCNISHIAWNISNTACSASIFKHNTTNYKSVSNTNLKEWGIYYKEHVRSIFSIENN